jgi:hypothetical protein
MEGGSRRVVSAAISDRPFSHSSRSASNHPLRSATVEFTYSVFPVSDTARHEGKSFVVSNPFLLLTASPVTVHSLRQRHTSRSQAGKSTGQRRLRAQDLRLWIGSRIPSRSNRVGSKLYATRRTNDRIRCDEVVVSDTLGDYCYALLIQSLVAVLLKSCCHTSGTQPEVRTVSLINVLDG